jgi:hypothetical protein
MFGRVLLAMSLVVLCPALAHAADQTVLGKQLLVKDPSTPDKRKVILKAVEAGTDNTLVGDPTVDGATLSIDLYGLVGGTTSSQVFDLPAGMNAKGKPFWSGDATKGYKYKDAKGENGPLKLAKLKIKNGTFQVKVVISGKGGAVSLVPPNDGVGACTVLTITGGDAYSIRFADGAVKNKGAKLFKIKNPTTQGTCTLICGNGLVDASEQCDEPGSSCGGSALCQSDCTCPCDFLDQADCLFPFPSDYLTISDPTTDTGRRVHFAVDSMPRNNHDVPVEPSDYNLNDGFSQGASIMLKVPGVDLAQTGAAPITDVERSLDADAPVVLIDTATLQKHLMFVELDANATSPATQAMFIRPAISLKEGGRYIVALRNMKDAGGAIIPPSADFAAYRDNTPAGDPVKEARRPHMEDIFSTLDDAGIGRSDLYLAWDFTVASQRNTTERMLFVRDDGFARLGANAPNFTVTMVEDDVDSRVFRRVTGTYEVERYVVYAGTTNTTVPPAHFELDANGLPIHQATPQVAPFQCIIPRAALADALATADPARASIYGHGLLGSNTEVASGNVRDMANEHNFVFCATKWIGMSDVDVVNAVFILQDLSKFPTLTDRLQQAMLDQLFLARLMIHPQGFISDDAFQDSMGNPVIDTSAVFYDGNSQGGIFGGTIMGIAQDITRGVLGVPGMNYSLLLTRSSDFTTYANIYYPAYPNELQRPLGLALIQMLWDRSEPNGYAQHITSDPLPGTPAHKVLLHLAFGDHQVANVSTEIEARTIGASIHTPAIAGGRHSDVDPYFGIPAIPSDPFDGSALIIWDSGAAQPPITNTAPNVGGDPHSDPRNSVIGRQQKSDFLTTGGAVVDVCPGIPCVP